MPIPPRPIPTPYHTRRRETRWRPSPVTDAAIVESRAEMALLPSRSVGSAQSLRGVRLMQMHLGGVGSAPSTRPGTPPSPFLNPSGSSSSSRTPSPSASPAPAATHEVSLASLMDGRGRPKRVGTASSLGFDFVPRPSIVALDESSSTPPPKATAPQPVEVTRSLWPWTTPDASAAPSSSLKAASAPQGTARQATSASASLPPGTPALVPSHLDENDEVEVEDIADSEDDDWEHVSAVEDDHIVGELELDVEDGSAGGKGQSSSSYATVASVRP